jgi:Fur family ferric uptake transcriptional regulator
MPDRSEELREILASYIQDNNLKNTRQRDAILDAFLETEGHASIDDLLAKVQTVNSSVGYATVYRALKLFVSAGIASERRFGDGPTLYEPAELGDHHDHLICTVCGRIFEFEDQLIEDRQEEVAKALGLKLTNHRMTLWGECVDRSDCDEQVQHKT